mgnify:CR=1 FL=1
MKQAVVTIKYEEEKLNAIKQYMGKKDADFESEMNEVLGKMYEKLPAKMVRACSMQKHYWKCRLLFPKDRPYPYPSP